MDTPKIRYVHDIEPRARIDLIEKIYADEEIAGSRYGYSDSKSGFYYPFVCKRQVQFLCAGIMITSNGPGSFISGLFGSLAAPLAGPGTIRADFNRVDAVQIKALYNYHTTVPRGEVGDKI